MRVLLTGPVEKVKELEICDIGLGYLASNLLNSGHRVRLQTKSITDAKFLELLKDYQPGAIGIKLLSSEIQKTIRTVRIIREATDCPVIIGGPHVSGDWARVLQYIPADYAIRGEGDRVLPRFVSMLESGLLADQLRNVPGLVWRDVDGIKSNPPDRIRKLDELPFPAWHLMPPAEHQSLVCKRFPVGNIQAARGCTNACTYCSEADATFRVRSVDNIMNEIRLLANEYGVREIHFLDSNFIYKKDFFMKLSGAILDSGLDLTFCAPNGTRLEAIDEEVCERLARMRMWRVTVGVESGDKDILRSVNKGLDLDIVPSKVNMLRSHGIEVVGNFMLGFPDETREQLQKTLDLALALNLSGANFSIYTPMPGTALFNLLVDQGKLPRDGGFDKWNYSDYQNNLSKLEPEALGRFRRRSVLRFLLRPSIVTKVVKLLRHEGVRKTLFNRFINMYVKRS